MSKERRIALKVPVLARVEGEGALDLLINEQQSRPYIESLALRIYEPPRYFEKLLEGRTVEELPEMVARICGICPVAYQMSALQAVESLFEVELSPWVRQMRRLFYCGEWIQSHSLHIHLLAAPDFLGYEHAIAMAEAYPDEVRRGLSLQGLGNKIIALLGGRSVHPVGARIGGFHHAPPPDEVATLLAEVNGAVVHAEALLRWLVMLERPVEEQSFTSVALREASSDYPMMGGEIISDRGLQLPVEQFESRFEELQRPHSTAFHAQLDGEPYLVGPLARMNLNFDRLLPPVSDLCATLGIHFPSRNMFDSLVARGVELLQALHEAALLLQQYQQPERPWVDYSPKAGLAFAATCAPRGMLWHRYEISSDGEIESANIVPPTSQNQARIEADLKTSLTQFGLDQPAEAIKRHGEQVIRNYDPCISCATHFLDLRIRRS